MALRFMDGFTHYSTSQLGLKWKGGISGTPTITGSAGRVSGDAMVCNSSEYVKWTGTATQTLIMGFAHKAVTESSDAIVMSFRTSINESSTAFADVRWDVSEDRYLLYIGGSQVGVTSALTQGDWNYIEFKVTVDNVIGAYELKINGTSELSATNVDTQPWSNGETIDIIWLGTQSGSGTHHYDDVYIADTTGSAPQNDFLGDATVETVFPDGVGTTTNFTPLAGANWENVDETNHDGDTTYNSTSTASNEDTLAVGALTATSGTVYGVQTNFTARKAAVGTRTMSDVIRTNAADFDGTTIGIGNTYKTYSEIHETNPDTLSAWAISEINAAEFGYKIQA